MSKTTPLDKTKIQTMENLAMQELNLHIKVRTIKETHQEEKVISLTAKHYEVVVRDICPPSESCRIKYIHSIHILEGLIIAIKDPNDSMTVYVPMGDVC